MNTLRELKIVRVNDNDTTTGFKRHVVEVELDGKPLILGEGSKIILTEPREIVERDISSITIDLGAISQVAKFCVPWKGEVKWFLDELNNQWVKFQEYNEGTQKTRTVVFPARLVLRVEYEAEDL